ncbi:GlxA family transcriptional regulator [Arachidicoccus terrestris]|uniref:GlxA family transcriptional regulator n=1 Tax=Arachidicoccus terrestris TaxID=2875539 RepID=UPI001CC3BA68|nr:helix-turn-helix domain-containing protein [Arachidicoccus terrestris]UAY55049.1 helix-turn-helix domain-containing protein [Arachidicoccus terrestris]
MKRLTIIIPAGQTNLYTIAGVVGAYEIFSTANEYCTQMSKRDLFKIELASTSKRSEVYKGSFALIPQKLITSIKKTDLIIIPSLVRNLEKIVHQEKKLIKWLQKQYENGAEIASMCTGAFMLASSGLLNGKSCSTHWFAADAFRTMFPKVNLQTDKLITDENGLYTNGGAYSFLNLLLYLIEKYYDRQTAILCSKIFQIEMDRQTQATFTIFTGQKLHGDELIKQAQTYIEDNISEKITVEGLAARFAVGRRHFDRRFIKATDNTPAEYVQRVKMEAAKRLIETTQKTINEVMYEVGYSDTNAFRNLFRKITGLPPVEYKHKYNREGFAQASNHSSLK